MEFDWRNTWVLLGCISNIFFKWMGRYFNHGLHWQHRTFEKVNTNGHNVYLLCVCVFEMFLFGSLSQKTKHPFHWTPNAVFACVSSRHWYWTCNTVLLSKMCADLNWGVIFKRNQTFLCDLLFGHLIKIVTTIDRTKELFYSRHVQVIQSIVLVSLYAWWFPRAKIRALIYKYFLVAIDWQRNLVLNWAVMMSNRAPPILSHDPSV